MGETSELEVLYRDERCIAIHKPPGLLVHRSPIDRRESQFAIQMLRDQIGQHVYPAHRLDRPTSGVLLFAFDTESCAALSQLFEARAVQKAYLAITRGHAPERGSINTPLHLYADQDGRKKREQTQEAMTEYRRLSSSELPYPTNRYKTSRFSLLALNPRTGRRHQLRRHLAQIRHPIVGDSRHGCNKTNKQAREVFQIRRLLLAATLLKFRHPYTGKLITINCPPDSAFASACGLLSLRL